MGSATQTPNVGLSQFADDDRPTWRGDYNGDMGKVDNKFGGIDGQIGVINTSLNTKVSKGSLVFDVRDYGAKGDGVTDDTVAIRNAITAGAASGVNNIIYFAAVPNGYLTTDTVSVPGHTNLNMVSPIKFSGSGKPALIVGESGANYPSKGVYLIRVIRATVSDWTNLSDIGVQLINHSYSVIHVAQADNFTIGVQTVGQNGQGFTYNKVTLGSMQDCMVGHSVYVASGGWVNENLFLGGSFHCSSSSPHLPRYGVRFTAADGSQTHMPNSNTWIKPSFEINGYADVTGTCVQADYAGPGNKFRDARVEGVGQTLPVATTGISWPIYFTMSYNSNAIFPYVSEGSSLAGSVVEAQSSFFTDNAKRLVARIDNLANRAAAWGPGNNGTTLINIPGLAFQDTSTVALDRRMYNGITMNTNYVSFDSSVFTYIYVSTLSVKTFTISTDAAIVGSNGRLKIRAYDVNGNILTAAGTVLDPGQANAFTYVTSFGGVWNTNADLTGDRSFTVSQNTAYIAIGVSGGTNPAQLRAISIYTSSPGGCSSWLPWVEDGSNRGVVAPTLGTYNAGRRVINGVPSVGAPKAWVCTAAGSPGTWVSEGNL